MNQKITLIPEAMYTLSARMRVNVGYIEHGDASQGRLVVGTAESGLNIVDKPCVINNYDTSPNAGKWVLCSATFTAPATGNKVPTVDVYVGFRAEGGTHSVDVDNVTLVRGGITSSYSPVTTFVGPNGATAISGNVGIGTTNPQKKVHITGSDDSGANAIFNNNNDQNDRPGIAIRGNYPEIDLISNATGNQNHGATLRFGAYDDANKNTWKHWVVGTPGVNATRLDFGYAANQSNPHFGIANYDKAWGGSSGFTVMSLTNAGNVGIGTASPNATLHVNGGIYLNDWSGSNASRWGIYTWGNQLQFSLRSTTDGLSGYAGVPFLLNKDGTANFSTGVGIRGGSGDWGLAVYGQKGIWAQVGDGNALYAENNSPYYPAIYGKSSSFNTPTLYAWNRGWSDGRWGKAAEFWGTVCINGDCRYGWGSTSGGSSTTSQWTTAGNNIFYDRGNVGIGTNGPGEKLTVVDGNIKVTGGVIYTTEQSQYPQTQLHQWGLGSDGQMYIEPHYGNVLWLTDKWGATGSVRVVMDHFSVGPNSSPENITLSKTGNGYFAGNIVLRGGKRLFLDNNDASSRYFVVNEARGERVELALHDAQGQPDFLITNQHGTPNTRLGSNGIRHSSLNMQGGNVGIGTKFKDNNPAFKLDVDGSINVAFANDSKKLALNDSSFGMDVAELFDAEQEVEEGDVLVVSGEGKKVKHSSSTYQKGLLGVVSSAPAVLFEGSELKLAPDPDRFTKGTKPPVTLAGRVHVKVNNENGSIQPGDYLTSSSVPGVAMKATDPGPTIGIALEAFNSSAQGTVLVFINVGENNVGTLVDEVRKIKDANDTIQKRLERLERDYVKARW